MKSLIAEKLFYPQKPRVEEVKHLGSMQASAYQSLDLLFPLDWPYQRSLKEMEIIPD